MIRKANQKNGLFILESIHLSASCYSVTPLPSFFDLWHHMLGYPSYDRLLLLQSKFYFPSNKSSCSCTACFRAKHKKSSFSDHAYDSLNAFDLVHMDV